MSIGQTGKRAQKLGRTKLERYKLQAGTGDRSALSPPARPRPDTAPSVARQPDTEPDIQRADEAPTATNTSAVQPADVSAGQSGNNQPGIEELADKVYELLLDELALERKRFGLTRR